MTTTQPNTTPGFVAPPESLVEKIAEAIGLNIGSPGGHGDGTVQIIPWGDLWQGVKNAYRQDSDTLSVVPSLFVDGWKAELTVVQDVWSSGISLLDDAFGVGTDWAATLLQGAAQYAADFLGIPTLQQIQGLANATSATLKRLSSRVGHVEDGLAHALDRLDKLDLQVDLLETINDLFTFPTLEALPEWIGETNLDLQYDLDGLDQLVFQLWARPVVTLEQLQPIIEQEIAVLAPSIVTNVINNFPGTALVETDPVAQPQIDVLIQTVTINAAIAAACCAAAQEAADEAQDCCNKLKGNLPDLSGILGLYTAAEVTAAVEAFVAGSGADVGGQVAGWLDGDISPVELAGDVVGGIGDVLGL